jgi:hypothetical protein
VPADIGISGWAEIGLQLLAGVERNGQDGSGQVEA